MNHLSPPGETIALFRSLFRGRSAAEAFLFQRLETLESTRGKFELNAELPIPFDGQGAVEIDIPCREARLAIELDGPQHLTGEDAWRRDRRKDLILLQNGFLILRLLATDTAKNLVLEQIQSALATRRSGSATPDPRRATNGLFDGGGVI